MDFPPVCPLDTLLNMKFEKDDDAWLADSTMATKLSIYSSKSLFEAILTKSRWTFQIYLQKNHHFWKHTSKFFASVVIWQQNSNYLRHKVVILDFLKEKSYYSFIVMRLNRLFNPKLTEKAILYQILSKTCQDSISASF